MPNLKNELENLELDQVNRLLEAHDYDSIFTHFYIDFTKFHHPNGRIFFANNIYEFINHLFNTSLTFLITYVVENPSYNYFESIEIMVRNYVENLKRKFHEYKLPRAEATILIALSEILRRYGNESIWDWDKAKDNLIFTLSSYVNANI